jgi:hypothetical protein
MPASQRDPYNVEGNGNSLLGFESKTARQSHNENQGKDSENNPQATPLCLADSCHIGQHVNMPTMRTGLGLRTDLSAARFARHQALTHH